VGGPPFSVRKVREMIPRCRSAGKGERARCEALVATTSKETTRRLLLSIERGGSLMSQKFHVGGVS